MQMSASKFTVSHLISAILLLVSGVRAYASTPCLSANQPIYNAFRITKPRVTTDTTVGKVIMVYIHQPGFSDNRAAEFSTDGQQIAGLTANELSEKFSKTRTVRVLNFLVANGYRVIGFAPARYGYNYLLEKVR